MFDPYYKWLGIRPEHQPPDHYRLLGLERFESDRDVIQAAGERQMAHVQSYKIGPQSELSQKILNEIARAKVCLLNAASKAQYDAGLRAAEARQLVPPPAVAPTSRQPVIQPAIQPAAQPASPAPPPPVQSAPAVELDSIVLPDSRRRSDAVEKSRSQRKPNNQLSPSMLIIAAGALCLFIVIAIALLLNSTGQRNAPQPRIQSPRPTAKPEFVASDNVPAADTPSPLESPAATDLTGRGIRTNPNRPLPTPGAVARQPIPTGQETQQAISQLNLPPKPTPAVTFNAALNAQQPAARYALLQMTIDLARQADYESWPDGKTFAIEAARLLITEFQLPREFYSTIVSQFRRRPPATPESMPSGIGENPRPVPGNPPPVDPRPVDPNVLVIDAPLIDLTKTQTEVKFKPTVPFESRKLILTGLGVNGAVLVRQYPDSGQVEIGTPIRVVLRDEPPRAGLEVSLHGTSELSVRIKPMIQDPDDVFYPWTAAGLKDVRVRVARLIRTGNAELTSAQRLVETLQEQVEAAKQSAAGAANRESLNKRLSIARIEADAKRNEAGLVQRFESNMSQLETLADEIDRKARLSFRVVQNSNGEEVPIVQTNP